jgi:cysteine desulfurase/selenocysteine lyase
MVGAAGSILNFSLDGVNSGELSRLLDSTRRIMVRSGLMCCHAWYRKHALPTTVRISLAPYNTLDEATELLRTLRDVSTYF